MYPHQFVPPVQGKDCAFHGCDRRKGHPIHHKLPSDQRRP